MDRCAGIDWAKEVHKVCVLEGDGGPVVERGIAHDERGVDGLCELLVELDVKRVAIERPDGVLVRCLLEAGLVVLPIHPNQLKAARPRFRAAGGKSDSFDAFCLAELARTDHHRFRVLAPDSDETKALRALTRTRGGLVRPRVSLTNCLHAELEAFWPGADRLFCKIASPIALAFLERYPSPRDARGLGEKRLARFLARHGYCGGKSAAELLAEIGDRRERYPTAEALAADAGMCPVAKESGKRKVATFRRACDKRLRDTLATLADSSRQHNPWAKDIYLRARGRGCDHPHAIRILGRAWVRVIWRMWRDGVPYDPLKHGGRRRLDAARG